jgi:glycosyltransferase involved in cell wall biosynthesis
MKHCDVSVVIPVFNRASLLRWPLASIAAQTLLPREVIIIDDLSAPEEAAIIRSLVAEFRSSLNVRLLVNEQNRGNSYSRNRAINDARGKYVAILDSDDVWLPEKLERQMRLVEAAKSRDDRPVLSATGTYRITPEGEILHRKLCQARFDAVRIRQSNYIPTSSIVVDTAIAREIGGFAEDMRVGSDWEFFIRLAGRVQFVPLPDALSAAVEHPGERLSQNNPKTLRAMLHTHRTHLRGMMDRCESASFCKKIASELQAHGRVRTARKFYVRSFALKHPEGWRRRLVEGLFTVYFSVATLPNLKEQRRNFYLRKPKEQRRDHNERAQWDRDQETLKALVACRPEGRLGKILPNAPEGRKEQLA